MIGHGRLNYHDGGAKPNAGDGKYYLGLERCRTNTLNVRFLADHVCFTPNGGHGRGVIGTFAPDPNQTLALPNEVEHWSLTTLREKLVKIGAKAVRHGRYVTFQLAEVAVPRDLFRKILRPIDDPRPSSSPASAGDIDGASKRQARCVCTRRKLAEWPFENGQTENVGPSDGCRGNAVPLAAESKYDFRELGAYLGNVGSNIGEQKIQEDSAS